MVNSFSAYYELNLLAHSSPLLKSRTAPTNDPITIARFGIWSCPKFSFPNSIRILKQIQRKLQQCRFSFEYASSLDFNNLSVDFPLNILHARF